MSEVNKIYADGIKTLEDYGAAICTARMSLATLRQFETNTYKQGLFEHDEEQVSLSIVFTLDSLFKLYETQLENVMERCDLNQESVAKSIEKLVKKPRKRVKKEDK